MSEIVHGETMTLILEVKTRHISLIFVIILPPWIRILVLYADPDPGGNLNATLCGFRSEARQKSPSSVSPPLPNEKKNNSFITCGVVGSVEYIRLSCDCFYLFWRLVGSLQFIQCVPAISQFILLAKKHTPKKDI
jgi:hypothetical protein